MSKHAAPQDAEPEAITIVVIGSFAWDMHFMVREILIRLWESHDRVAVNLVTSGCPQGAEAMAREVGKEFGWNIVVLRDEDISQLPAALVLAFLKDESYGAAELVEHMTHRYWTRIFRDETVKQVSTWLNR